MHFPRRSLRREWSSQIRGRGLLEAFGPPILITQIPAQARSEPQARALEKRDSTLDTKIRMVGDATLGLNLLPLVEERAHPLDLDCVDAWLSWIESHIAVRQRNGCSAAESARDRPDVQGACDRFAAADFDGGSRIPLVNSVILAIVIFLALFTQSLAGFGLALVSMPLLVGPLGIHVATPLVALVALISELFLLFHYRQSLDFRILARLAVASIFGIPLGILALRWLDEGLILDVLGGITIGYAAYSLTGNRLPELRHRNWAYSFGLLAGILGGAYNISGPPVILYADSKRWSRDQFKANLQGLFVLEGGFLVLGHALAGNLTSLVWRDLLISLAPMVLGIWAGLKMDKRLDTRTFRKVILVLLVIIGARLLLS